MAVFNQISVKSPFQVPPKIPSFVGRRKEIQAVTQNLVTKFTSIHLINLPAYVPDTNPQEHVWKYGKDKISKGSMPVFRRSSSKILNYSYETELSYHF